MASKILQSNNIFSFSADGNVADGNFDEFFNSGNVTKRLAGQFILETTTFKISPSGKILVFRLHSRQIKKFAGAYFAPNPLIGNTRFNLRHQTKNIHLR